MSKDQNCGLSQQVQYVDESFQKVIMGNQKGRILFVTTSYEQKANSAAIRNNAWVSGLIANGYRVEVLTPEWPDFMRSSFLMSQNKAPVIRTKLPELKALSLTRKEQSVKFPKFLIGLRHIIRDLMFFPDVCKNWKKHVDCIDLNKYDALVSSSDFKSSHMVAYGFKKRCPNLKWIQVWGDPWSTDINLSWVQRRKAGICERKMLQAADEIIYVSDLTKNVMQDIYKESADKMHYIPRGFYKPVYKCSNAESGNKPEYSIVYTGVLSKGRHIEDFCESMERYNAEHSKRFKLDLYGNYNHETIRNLSVYPSVRFNESIDYDSVLDVYKKADILLFVSNGNNSSQIPGKLFDYLGTTLPVLCLIEPEEPSLENLLNKYDNCFVVKNIKELIDDSFKIMKEIMAKSYKIEKSFSPETIGATLSRIIETGS